MKVTIDLPDNMAYLFKIYALVLEETIEGIILQHLDDVVENLESGEILGEEIASNYKHLFTKQAEEPAPSS